MINIILLFVYFTGLYFVYTETGIFTAIFFLVYTLVSTLEHIRARLVFKQAIDEFVQDIDELIKNLKEKPD